MKGWSRWLVETRRNLTDNRVGWDNDACQENFRKSFQLPGFLSLLTPSPIPELGMERGIGGSCHVVDSVRKEKERLTAVSTSKQRFGDSSSTIPTLTLKHPSHNHPSPMLEEGLGDGEEDG